MRLKRSVLYQAAETTQCAVLRDDHWIEPVTAEAMSVPCNRLSIVEILGFRRVTCSESNHLEL